MKMNSIFIFDSRTVPDGDDVRQDTCRTERAPGAKGRPTTSRTEGSILLGLLRYRLLQLRLQERPVAVDDPPGAADPRVCFRRVPAGRGPLRAVGLLLVADEVEGEKSHVPVPLHVGTDHLVTVDTDLAVEGSQQRLHRVEPV